jgi:hypothetical protein
MTIEIEEHLAPSQNVAIEAQETTVHHQTDFIESLQLDSLSTQLDAMKKIIFNTSVPDNPLLGSVKNDLAAHRYQINSHKIAQKLLEQTETLCCAEPD